MEYDSKTLDDIVEKFRIIQPLHEKFGERIESLIKDKIKNTKISDYIVSSRPKSIESFSRKIQKKNYLNPLKDITDLTGVRVLVCYIDQIKIVEDILFNEFSIDIENSIDRAKVYEENTFGYLSVHYIIYNSSLKEGDSKWKKFNGMKAEVQLRTTLQHSWALVNHSLYKNESEVPKGLWRRLIRLSALFELADQEFIEIRNINEKYRLDLITEFDNNQTDKIEINYYSLNELISRNTIIISVMKLARDYNLLLEDNAQKEYYNKIDSSSVVEICKYFKVSSIRELSDIIDENTRGNNEFIISIAKSNIWKFTKPFIIFLLLFKIKHSVFPTDYLIKKYGWEKKRVNFLLEILKKI